jgi:hypothetical protein
MKDEKSRNLFEASLDAIDYVQDKISDISYDVEHAIRDKATELRDKTDKIIHDKVDDGKVEGSTIGMATGAVKIGYGLVRGGFAVAGILGHGIAGYFMRHHNPAGAKHLVEHGFDAAKKHIGEGLEIFKDALEERQKK